jgi:chromosome segregation ATPase
MQDVLSMISRMCAALALSLLAGCASDPVPEAQLQVTEQALAQARAVGTGAEQAELRQAEEGLAAARQAVERQEFRQARMLAERAELDARLAEAQTLTAKSRAQVAELRNELRRLRTQLGEQP